ncbi:MAG: T9SS type A sorting domain-containing protein, partial [bacterium]
QFHQIQSGAPIFKFPLEISVTSPDSIRTLTVFIDDEWENFSFVLPSTSRPVMVELDPNSYVLMKYYYRGTSIAFNHSHNPFFFALEPYPNPFNSSLNLTLYVPMNGLYSVSIYDLLGNEVAIVEKRFFEKGKSIVSWSPPGNIPSGAYFVVFKGEGGVVSKGVIYLK